MGHALVVSAIPTRLFGGNGLLVTSAIPCFTHRASFFSIRGYARPETRIITWSRNPVIGSPARETSLTGGIR